MADYPFNLRGERVRSNGPGQRGGETYKSREFTLKPGIVYAEIEHHGHGDFTLEFVPTEGFTRGEATTATIGGSFATSAAAGIATGAAIGSIVPVAGTIVGAAVGGAVGWFAGNKVGNAISDAMQPSVWTPVNGKGRHNVLDIVRVTENDGHALPPGRYRLEVKSQSRWNCQFIQPELGQSNEPLANGESFGGDDENVPAGTYVLGPYRSGARPILATFWHDGGGTFLLEAIAVDGTHEYVYSRSGQFINEDVRTDILPGKEYLLVVSSAGDWDVEFTEGY